ncbi:MAG: MBL fold metallo-hydrolase [Gammaproteobacteria bacterium]|nr:MBL fold metallo-hydrolase [Gammaproteobacteria bacterium]
MSLKVEVVIVTAFQQNCSIIWCTETNIAAVVDPGGDVESILGIIKKNNLKAKKILLTHGHLDHAGGAARLAREINAPIVGPHQDDEFWLQGIEKQASTYGLSGVENCSSDQWLDEGDEIIVGNEKLAVFHCPGHTPGHVIFYHKDAELAFVGDVLFKGSIGRTDFPRGDHPTLINSITSKLWPLGNKTRFISGHGEISDFGSERSSNPFVSDRALGLS